MRYVHLIVEGIGWCSIACAFVMVALMWSVARVLPSNEEILERKR